MTFLALNIISSVGRWIAQVLTVGDGLGLNMGQRRPNKFSSRRK